MSESWEERTRTWLKGLFGDSNEKRVKALQVYVDRANSFEPTMKSLTDEQLKAKTAEFRRTIDEALKNVPDVKLIPDDAPKMPGQFRTQKDKVLDEVLEKMLPEAFAVVRETGRRVLNMRHFDVQLMGGAALHFNKISEMRTGEGKTLVATLPVYLNALTGRGVHVVTVNDYLAKRDAEWMGHIYKFLGLTVGLVYSHQSDEEKYEAYRCDISYGTNHEFGFDYLRDNMRKSLDQLVQRPYYFAVVDEVDNILIDEARTPLIISGFPTESFQEVYLACAKAAPMLERGMDKEDEDCDYWVDEKGHNILLTERGQDRAEQILGVTDLFDLHFNYHHHIVQALKAKELYKLDVNYVIRPNEEGKLEAVIVDEFTGRMMQGRRWSDGLHQAVEAKEGIPIQEETLTYASITYQNLFRLYPKLSGMTGTAMTEAAEFNKIYNLDVVAIPTNKTAVRGDQPDVIYKTEMQKYISVVEEIVECYEEGRPVLVGTTSIEKSELVDALLSKPQTMGEVLLKKIQKVMDSIKKHNLQGENIDALKKLFERPALIDTAKMEEVCKLLEKDYPKKHEEFLERIFSALRTARVVAAVRKGIPHHVLNAKHHEKEAMIVAQAGRKGAVTVATNMAGRGTDILLGGNPEYLAKQKILKDSPDLAGDEYDAKVKELTKKFKEETDKEHDEVVAMGGLHIIGTERHEARRIDNQLRGRAGRQGDPGSTRFFLSLEDQLMRIFGGDKIARLMELIRADEEMPIESGMVSKSIENAQKKVESHHFDMRKHVLQYDDVLNTQREVIYRERRRLLERADLRQQVLDMLQEHLDMLLESYIDPDSPPELWEEEGLPQVTALLKNDIPLLDQLKDTELHGLSYDDLRAELWKQIKMAYEVREQHIGLEHMREMERQILLNTIDGKWVDYLHNIDLLREGIHLRGYGQRDPLQEYKREAFDMFNRLLKAIKEESIQLIFRAQPVIMDMDDLEGMILNELKNLGGEGDEVPNIDQQQFADLVSGFLSGKTPEELGLIGKEIAEQEEADLDEAADENLKDVLEHLGEIDAKNGEEPKKADQPVNGEDKADAEGAGGDSEKKTEVKAKSGARKGKGS